MEWPTKCRDCGDVGVFYCAACATNFCNAAGCEKDPAKHDHPIAPIKAADQAAEVKP